MCDSFLCSEEIGRTFGVLPDRACQITINNGRIFHPYLRMLRLGLCVSGKSGVTHARRSTSGYRHQTPWTYQKPGPRAPRALDPNALKAHTDAFPDETLKERARHFGVSTLLQSD